jgi:hypothetical protein
MRSPPPSGTIALKPGKNPCEMALVNEAAHDGDIRKAQRAPE